MDLGQMSKKEPFSVPENYFQELPSLVMKRVRAEQRKRLFQRAMVVISAVAAVALVVVAMMIFLPQEAPAPQFANVSLDSIIAPISDAAAPANAAAADDAPQLAAAQPVTTAKRNFKTTTNTATSYTAADIPAEILLQVDEYFCDLDCEMIQYYHSEFLNDEYYELK